MKQLPWLFSVLVCSGLARGSDRPDPVWTVADCAGTPSHVLFDPDSESLFVSQISGAGDVKDGDGIITRLSLDGYVTKCAWHSGLHAPKGLARRGDVLWVSDIDELCEVRIDDATLVRRVPVAGAKFLVGVSVDAQGTVYAADMLTSSIYRLRDGECAKFVFGPGLESPAGLIAEKDRFVLAAWGLTTDYTTETPGRLLALNLKSGETEPFSKRPLGNLYGLVSDGGKGYLGTDWASGRVFHFSSGAEPRELFALPKGAAGIEYVPAERLLVVAELTESRISAFDLSSVLNGDGR